MLEDNKHITLETAKLLKEKGFQVFTKGYHVEYLVDQHDPEYPEGGGSFSMTKGDVNFDSDYMKNGDKKYRDYTCESYGVYSAPTQTIVQKWLREQHKIHIDPQYSRCNDNTDIEWWFYLYPEIGGGGRIKFFPDEIGNNLDYEDALEIGIKEGLKLIKL